LPAIPQHLIEEIRGNRVVAFVGAGFTAPAGFPGWADLLLKTSHAAYSDEVISSDEKLTIERLLVRY
jgi:hypothetical protein